MSVFYKTFLVRYYKIALIKRNITFCLSIPGYSGPSQLLDPETKVYPSITHGTAIPWSASTSLQTQIQEYATSTNHDAEYYANRIVNILKEAGVKGDWNLVD